VLTYPSTKAVIPNFGLEPNIGGGVGELSLLFCNTLREYLEEMHNYEDLIGESREHQRLAPDWFKDLPEAKHLLKLRDEGSFLLEFLGFGFDGLNGTATIALLAAITDVNEAHQLRTSFYVNWEVASANINEPPIIFVDFKSELLRDYVKLNCIQYGSAFTISLASKRLLELVKQTDE
jgi:hypothetical protein